MDETRLSLLQRVRNPNDQESWREFYDLYHSLLLSFVRSKGIDDHASAEDIVQELLISLARRLPELEIDKHRGRFRTYLWQASHNAVVTWLRKNSKHHAMVNLDTESRIAELEDKSRSAPDREFVAALQQRVLEHSIVKLKSTTNSDTWECFRLHILERIPATEVALRLKRSETSVFVNANRIKKKLREICAEYLESHDDELGL